MSEPKISDPKLFGRIAVQKEYLTREQWKKAVSIAENAGGASRLHRVLIKKGYMDEEQIRSVLRKAERYAQKTGESQKMSGRTAASSKRTRSSEPPVEEISLGGDDEAPSSSGRVRKKPVPELETLSLGGDDEDEGPARPSRPKKAPPPAPALLDDDDDSDGDDEGMQSSMVVPVKDVDSRDLRVGHLETIPPRARPYLELLKKAALQGASDIHLQTGAPPYARIAGKIVYLKSEGPLEAEANEAGLLALLDKRRREIFEEEMDLDFSFEIPGVARFRASLMRQYRGVDGVFRIIPVRVPTIEELGLPPEIARFTTYHQGLVLCTGPAGCGKSTTMATLVEKINLAREEHIITVEDPIEYVFESRKSLINQREVGRDTESFGRALRASLREDPDVIMVGELRDRETISLAITAAETGHLVFGTLHTNNAIRTINRLTDAFPHEQQAQIRSMVSESLRGVISQQLIYSPKRKGQVAAVEILFLTPAVSNLIRDNRTFQIKSMMQTGRSKGMRLMDQSLQELVKAGEIAKDDAWKIAEDKVMFR